jgi:hypothetical protein
VRTLAPPLASAGGAEAAGDGVDGEEKLGHHRGGGGFVAGLERSAPASEQGDLLGVKDAEGFRPEGERAAEARAPAFESGSSNSEQVGAGAVPLGFESRPDPFAQDRVLDEARILAHDLEVAAGEGGLDVGDEVMEEGTGPEVGLEAGDVGVGECGEGGAGTVPSGEVEPRLGPREDPGDGAEIGEAGLAGATGRARSDPRVLEGVERRGLAVEGEEVVGLEERAVLASGFCGEAFEDGDECGREGFGALVAPGSRSDTGKEEFEVVSGGAGIAVLLGDGLALFGEADRAVEGTGW